VGKLDVNPTLLHVTSTLGLRHRAVQNMQFSLYIIGNLSRCSEFDRK